MRGPDADARDRTRTAPAGAPTRTFADLPPTASPPHAPDTRPSPVPVADRSTPSGPPGFDLLGKIGEGGMGTVQKAREVRTGRVVALKVLKLNVFDERVARERFDREVRVMARIEHPHLVPLYQSGEHNGVPYFTMKYMPGGILSAVRTGGPLSPPRAAELLRAIAGGVAALHAAGILHRDLKPSNVLLDEEGTPHVADFGLVKWVDDDEHTQTGVRNGTPQYMSPEQVAGRSRKLTAACDVWALGVIGYELACGRRPFDHDDREDLYRAISNDPPPDPYSLAPGLPPPLAQVLMVCLNKDPLARYPTAAELVADLDRFLAGQPVNAASPETVTLPARPKRRTVLKVAAGLLGVGAAGGLGATTYFLTRKKGPPEPSFTEVVLAAFDRGEAVDLLAADGRPRWHAVVPADALIELPAVQGTFTVLPNPNTPKPHTNGWLDLFADPLPGPYRFEAELCFRGFGEGRSAFAGVYLGRRLWEAGGVQWQTAAVVWHELTVATAESWTELCVQANPVKERFVVSRATLTPDVPPPPPFRPPLDRWFRVAVELRGENLSGRFEDVRLDPGPDERGAALRRKLAHNVADDQKEYARKLLGPVTPPPTFEDSFLFGPALGLFVWDATVSVKSARLVPLAGDPG